MMRRSVLPLVTLILFTTLKSFSQCTPSVLSNSVVVNSTTTINGGFDPVWVCSGDTLHSDGGFHNVYLEPGSVMTTLGGIDTIYVKDGASLIMGGGIHVIFYVTFSDLNIAGGIPYEFVCPSLEFDYANAPSNGCAILPIASFQSSDSTICTKTCISFSSISVSAESWQWIFDGATPSESSEENPENICYNASGIYDVSLIVIAGNETDTLTLENFITVFPETAVPILSQNNDTLYCSQGYLSYQWYLGDTLPISGATDYYYVPEESGAYTIVVTDSNGCQSSGLINAVVTSVYDPDGVTHSLNVFPNPATKNITITTVDSGNLFFFDLSGREIYSMIISPAGKIDLDISSFPIVFFIKTERGEVKKIVRN